MAGYRFCRSDDIPLLVEAYNACYKVRFPDLAPMTVDGFKRMTRELNVWTSSCMVAAAEGRPIGVMLAAKRDGDANWIHSLGVDPDFQRQGHGKHLLTSLSQKLAILGPRRMTLELPAGAQEACRFVESCGYREAVRYTDFVRPPKSSGGAASELVIPTTLDELLQNEVFDSGAQRCWQRAPRTLMNLADRLHGLAIASAERIEAWLLYDDEQSPDERRIMALETRDDAAGRRMLSLLLEACASTTQRPLALRRACKTEVDFAALRSAGFESGTETQGYAMDAQPG